MSTEQITAKATALLTKRTDDQIVNDLKAACIENRLALHSEDYDRLELVNLSLTWIENELDRRFGIDKSETIIDATWDEVDAA